jgi:poly(A) polymerase
VPPVQPEKQREFAVEVVRQLRDRGYEAYWAGGCVRDQLLGRIPVDYDVATSAKPEEIRNVFPHRKTLAVGAAFGVMTVLGPRAAGQIEVATFRQDLGYSDGRHPDQVKFSSPQEDAKRRDFTINGMFYDPLEQKVIDFVGGEDDLKNHVVRAIGDPRLRIEEDKLRMLRAVRFASVFNFHLDENTHAAICEMAPQVTVVSAERIADEMRRTLVQPNRVRAVQLFSSTGLLQAILPEVAALVEKNESNTAASIDIPTPWRRTLAVFGAFQNPTFPLAMAALLREATDANLAETIGKRWRLARAEIERMAWLLANKKSLADAAGQKWSQLQPRLVDAGAKELLEFCAAQAAVSLTDRKDVEFCRIQMERPITELDPPPLLTGDDLIGLGIPRGPVYAKLLKAVRAAQLDGVIGDRVGALEMVARLQGEG